MVTAIRRNPQMAGLHYLGNLWFTLVLLVLFALAVLATDAGWLLPSEAMVLPFTLLVFNLVAAIVVNPRFRRTTPLLVFHLSLLALILLALLGRLTYLQGQVLIPVGEEFGGELGRQEQGPWHQNSLDNVLFSNEGFEVDYDRRAKRNRTYNKVRWPDADGRVQEGIIGDDRPLLLQGYRIYTSNHRGFALQFTWLPANKGLPSSGLVTLKSWPRLRFEQAQQWRPPGTDLDLWVKLEFDDSMLDEDRPWTFAIPERHRVIVRVGEQGRERHELQVGGSLELAEGELLYDGVQSWMGYEFYSDWTLPWIGAASFAAVLALAWFYWRRFSARPWIAPDDDPLL